MSALRPEAIRLELKYKRSVARQRGMWLLIVSIPLLVSTYTHIFNAIGFPCIHADEGKYIRRGLHFIDKLALQDSENQFDHGQDSTSTYDHPYFGNLFLGGVFMLIGYPNIAGAHVNSTTTTGNAEPELGDNSILESIETLYLIPRVLMGLLAVLDTFLIYKITQVYYSTKNGKIAGLLAALLFAVMPLTWMTRRVFLDSILLPFVLSSILFAVYYNRKIAMERNDPKKKNITIILVSGIFLGIAIFTKIPAITMIPLVASLVFLANGFEKDTQASTCNNFAKHLKDKFKDKRNMKNLGIFLIPVILIPMIWPAYATYLGEFDEWVAGVLWQAEGREGKGVTSLEINFLRDPLLITLGFGGIVFSLIRRDLFVPLAFFPFLIFISVVGWAQDFHWILVIPVLCIAASVMLTSVLKRLTIKLRNKWQMILSIALMVSITLFGLVSSTLIISVNTSSYQFKPLEFIGRIVLDDTENDEVSIIIAPEFAWVFKYFFKEDNIYQTRDSNPIETERIILVNDRSYRYVVSDSPSKAESEDPAQVERLKKIFETTKPVAIFIPSKDYNTLSYYPYNNVGNCGIGVSGTEIRINY